MILYNFSNWAPGIGLWWFAITWKITICHGFTNSKDPVTKNEDQGPNYKLFSLKTDLIKNSQIVQGPTNILMTQSKALELSPSRR